MLVKNICVLVMFFVIEMFQQEIRALQSHLKFLPGASLNMPVNTTVLDSDILCAWLCIQAKPECTFAGYSRAKGICELYATKFVVFSDVNNMFKLYSSGLSYAWVNQSLTWAESKLYCEARGWHLAHIQSENEHEILKNALTVQFGLASGCNFWIGGSRQGQFLWTDNTNVAVNFGWYPGQPDNWNGGENCIGIEARFAYSWNDMPCYYKFWSLCEY